MANGHHVAMPWLHDGRGNATLDEIVAEIHQGIRIFWRRNWNCQQSAVTEPDRGLFRLVRRRESPDLGRAVAASVKSRMEISRHLRSRADRPQIISTSSSASRRKRFLCRGAIRHDEAGGAMKPRRWSPAARELPLTPQSRTAGYFGATAPDYACTVTYEEIPQRRHFTIMNELMMPTGRITTLIRRRC